MRQMCECAVKHFKRFVAMYRHYRRAKRGSILQCVLMAYKAAQEIVVDGGAYSIRSKDYTKYLEMQLFGIDRERIKQTLSIKKA